MSDVQAMGQHVRIDPCRQLRRSVQRYVENIWCSLKALHVFHCFGFTPEDRI